MRFFVSRSQHRWDWAKPDRPCRWVNRASLKWRCCCWRCYCCVVFLKKEMRRKRRLSWTCSRGESQSSSLEGSSAFSDQPWASVFEQCFLCSLLPGWRTANGATGLLQQRLRSTCCGRRVRAQFRPVPSSGTGVRLRRVAEAENAGGKEAFLAR